MDIRYTRSGSKNYVNFLFENVPDLTSYEMQMVLSGQVLCLLPCSVTKIDGITSLAFDITAKKSLSTCLENGLLSTDRMTEALAEILKGLQTLPGYLLDPERIPLHPDYVYLSEAPLSASFCFLPEGVPNPRKGLLSVMEMLVHSLDPSRPEALLSIYRVYQAVRRENPPPEELLPLLIAPVPFTDNSAQESPESLSPEEKDDLSDDPFSGFPFSYEPAPLPPEGDSDRPETFSPAVRELFAPSRKVRALTRRILLCLCFLMSGAFLYAALILYPYSGAIKLLTVLLTAISLSGLFLEVRSHKKKAPEKTGETVSELSHTRYDMPRPLPEETPFPDWFAETDEPEKTVRNATMLLSSRPDRARLLPLPGSSGSVIPLPGKTSLLGKDPGPGGITIPEDTVSRVHARLYIGEDRILLEDLNSTNGTYVNGEALQPKEKKPLKNGDRIRFAALEYILSLPGQQ